MLGKMALNLLAKILEMSLYVVLHRLMGRNLCHFCGVICFWEEGDIGFVNFNHGKIGIQYI